MINFQPHTRVLPVAKVLRMHMQRGDYDVIMFIIVFIIINTLSVVICVKLISYFMNLFEARIVHPVLF